MTPVLQIAPLPTPADYRPPQLPITLIAESSGLTDWLERQGASVRAVVTHAGKGMPAEMWSALPNLELIASFGVGLDRIDLAMAKRRGVRITYTPDALTDDVADLAVGLIIAALRGVSSGDRFVRAGRWTQQAPTLGRSSKGRRLGILGLGRIGLAIARRAEVFGMRIAYHSRSRRAEERYTYCADAKILASNSDLLCVCTPGGAETQHLVDRHVLEALGAGGYLINIARGSAVDEKALLAGLQNGTIAGAALDVFENEPAIDPAFFTLENVTLTPHIGSATSDTRVRMANEVFANVQAFLDDRPLKDVVPL